MKKFLSLFCLIAIAWLCNVAYAETTSVDDVIKASNLAATSSTYTDFSDIIITSGAVYSGNTAKYSSGSIQLRSKSNSGIVSTASPGKVKKVVVEWDSYTTNGRTLDVYGSNTAYTAASDLYNDTPLGEKLGSIVCGTSTELVIEGDYKYIGLRSKSSAMYLKSITISWDPTIIDVVSIANYNEQSLYSWAKFTCSLTITKAILGNIFVKDANGDFGCIYTKTTKDTDYPDGYVIPAGVTGLKGEDNRINAKNNLGSIGTPEEGSAVTPKDVAYTALKNNENLYGYVKVAAVPVVYDSSNSNYYAYSTDTSAEGMLLSVDGSGVEITDGKTYTLTGIVDIFDERVFLRVFAAEEVNDGLAAPTVSLAAGTYYQAQTLTITAPEGATLDGWLNETVIENVSEFTTTLAIVNDDITTYELYVCSTKDGVSSDPVSATFVINPNVIDAEVTGNIVIADQDAEKFIATSSRMEKDKEYILTDNFGTEFTIKTVSLGSGGSLCPGRFSSNGSQLRMNNVGDVVSITSPYAINSVTLTADAAFKINDTDIEAVNGTYTWTNESGADVYSFTITSTVAKKNITKIAINYTGRFDYHKVKDGAALIGMEKGKFYQVNVNLQGVEANGGVLYARTAEASAAPSEPRKDHDGFDSYEDGYKLNEFNQRDWVAIKGLGSEYEGFALGTFIAAYDGEKLTSVVSNPAKGDAEIDITNINTFGVANVFYGNYENTESLGMENNYRPFFVKAKVNEVANFVGKVTKDTNEDGGSFRLEGSGKCGVFEGKGVLLEAANGVTLSVSGDDYKQFTGVLVAETNNTLAKCGVKIVALSAPTTPTGVAALKADGKATVYGTEGAVVVNGADGKVMIFDAMGRMVKSVNAEGAATVAMPAGYYIVRTAGTAAKVMVK